jgi:hypothetical protein
MAEKTQPLLTSTGAAPPSTPSRVSEKDIIPKSESPPAGSESAAEIPEEVLNIPVIYGLLNGAPPAVYAEKSRQDPEIRTVVKHSKELIAAGFGFYPSLDKKLTVLYNGSYVSEESLKKADDAGQLTRVVPSYDEVKSSFESAISGEAPGGSLPGAPTTPTAGSAPPSSRVLNTLATARTKNLQPGSPTSGPVPGGGRILSNILRPTI